MKAKTKKDHPDRIFTDKTPLIVYRLAKTGMSDRDVAKALGVPETTFRKWKRERDSVKYALDEARRADAGAQTYMEYVYDQLPEHLKPVWEAILDPTNNPITYVERMLKDCGKRGRQHLFLHALVHYNWNATEACRAVNIRKITFDRWVTDDPGFGELVREMDWHKKNFFEAQLISLVKAGDPALVKFVNQTYNADRGYGTKKEVRKSVDVNVRGQVGHAVVTLDDLDLPVEERRKLLQKIRDRDGDRVLPAKEE